MSRHQAVVTLELDEKTEYGEFSAEVAARITAMGTTGLVYIAAPVPTPANAQTNLDKYNSDVGIAGSHAAGTATAAGIAKKQVITDMKAWQVLVQKAVDAAPNLAAGILIAQSCHFPIKDESSFSKDPFAVRHAGVGTIWVFGRALANREAWLWEISNDGTNFTFLECTLESNYLATGLASGKRYWFRGRPILKKSAGKQPYTVALDIIVT